MTNYEEKMKRVYKTLFDEMNAYFPNVTEKLDRWYPSGPMQIIAVTTDGERYEYNGMTGYIHRMPDIGDISVIMDESKWRKEFSYKLRRKMSCMSITQRDLSELSGISEITISNYITGKATPSTYNLMRLTRAFDCDVSELIDFYVEEKK